MSDKMRKDFTAICKKLNFDPHVAREKNWDVWVIWSECNGAAEKAIQAAVAGLKKARSEVIARDARIRDLELSEKPPCRRLNSPDVARIRARALREGMTPYQLAKEYERFIYKEEP